MAQGDWGRVCENILIHMSSRVWLFVISSCLISSSLPSVSSPSLISSSLLSWSSSSMWSEPPSTKSTAHTQNVEYCTVAIHNPLTWMFLRPRSSNFSHHLLPHRRHWLESDWTIVQLRHLADPIPNTGYEPKFCIDVSSEHTPINLPTRNMSFPPGYDVTITASEDLHLPRHSGASSSSLRHGSKQSSHFCWNWVHQGPASRKCRRIMTLLQVGPAWRRPVVVSSLFGSVSKGGEIETKTLCQR